MRNPKGASERSLEEKRSLGASLNTPAEILRCLSGDKNSDVRELVASNLNTPSDALLELAEDSYPYVLYKVARNPNTLLVVLWRY
jgi:hypothetical protein